MENWDDLKEALLGLREDQRRPLRSFPGLDRGAGGGPPFRITLAPWASDVAEELHARFGDSVDLTVGVLHFPDLTLRGHGRSLSEQRAAEQLPLLPSELVVTLAEPIVVRSGFECRGALEIANRGSDEYAIHTNGTLTARVVDPETRTCVGGFGGWQTLPLVVFRPRPGETVLVPLLVGTSSFRPELGYAVPSGEWAVDAVVDLHELGRFLTPQLVLTVTD